MVTGVGCHHSGSHHAWREWRRDSRRRHRDAVGLHRIDNDTSQGVFMSSECVNCSRPLYSQIRQVGLRRRPISNVDCLSTEGPVVKDPVSANGISMEVKSVSYVDNLDMLLTHGRKALHHDQIPFLICEDSHIFMNAVPRAARLQIIPWPIWTPLILRPRIIR